ncbi:MAG: hypothetical protein AB7E95_11610 [Kiritimatiellales bacterium]
MKKKWILGAMVLLLADVRSEVVLNNGGAGLTFSLVTQAEDAGEDENIRTIPYVDAAD